MVGSKGKSSVHYIGSSLKSRAEREGYENAGRVAHTLVVSYEEPERAHMKPNKEPIVGLRGYMKGKLDEIPSSDYRKLKSEGIGSQDKLSCP